MRSRGSERESKTLNPSTSSRRSPKNNISEPCVCKFANFENLQNCEFAKLRISTSDLCIILQNSEILMRYPNWRLRKLCFKNLSGLLTNAMLAEPPGAKLITRSAPWSIQRRSEVTSQVCTEQTLDKSPIMINYRAIHVSTSSDTICTQP